MPLSVRHPGKVPFPAWAYLPDRPRSALLQSVRDRRSCRRGIRAGRPLSRRCCGASPMLIREVAEAVGRTTEASRYSEKMANHFLYGTNEWIADHIRALGDRA